MKLGELPQRINELFTKAALNIEAVRHLLFTILLVVSAFSAIFIVFGGQEVFFKSELVLYSKFIVMLWIICHFVLFFIGRNNRLELACFTYLVLAFMLVSAAFQSTTLSHFEKIILQFPITYTILFIALLLLPFKKFFQLSSLICGVSIIWIIIIQGKFLPPFGINIAVSFITQIFSHWILGILVARIMQLHYQRILESQAELANHNEKLEEEVAANVKVIKMQQEQLYQAQKLEALGQLTGGLSHDFNNYLTAILGFGKLAGRRVEKGSPVWRNINQIVRAGEKLSALTKQLLLFSRKQPMNPGIIDINKTITGLLKMLNRLIREDVTIKTDFAEDIQKIRADEVNIEQVIVNLVVNARDALPDGGTLTIRTENVTMSNEDLIKIPNSKEGKYVCLSVEDNGVGIDTETQKKIFEPFFTTKEVGKGTGLGLSVIYGIVQEHKGWINVFSEEGRGTTFKIYLATTEMPFTVRKKGDTTALNAKELGGNGERVLVIEDQEEILNFCEVTLNENGYQATTAKNADEAYNSIKAETKGFEFIITDIVLPGKSGINLVKEIEKMIPSIGIILTSGYSDKKEECEELIQSGVPFLQKPFDSEQLLRAIKKVKKKSPVDIK